MSIAYYNGAFAEYERIAIPLCDRSVYFGDAIYDAAIGRGGRIYLEDMHISRFMKNAERLGINLTLGRDGISDVLHEVIRKNDLDFYFIYFQLSRTASERRHAFKDGDGASLLVTIREHTLPDADARLKLITERDIRHRMCDVKTTCLLPAALASRRAESEGCDEAVLLRDGIVTECAHSNIAIVKNGVLLTHPNSPYILPGITRERLLFYCERLNIPYKEEPFAKDELYSADEILVTSTTKLALLASEIDKIPLEIKKNSLGETLISALRDDYWNLME